MIHPDVKNYFSEPVWNAAKGALLASSVVTVVAPLLYAKNRFQTGQPFIFKDCMKGAPLIALNMIPQAAVAFASRQIIAEKFYQKKQDQLSSFENLTACSAAGFISGIFSNPTEFWVQNYQNNWQKTLKKVVTMSIRQHGFRSLFRGSFALGAREGLYVGGYLFLMQEISNRSRPHTPNQLTSDIIGAVASGAIVGYITTPPDTLRANKQWIVRNWNYRKAFRHLKFPGLMSGWMVRVGAVSISNLIMGIGMNYLSCR